MSGRKLGQQDKRTLLLGEAMDARCLLRDARDRAMWGLKALREADAKMLQSLKAFKDADAILYEIAGMVDRVKHDEAA